MPSDLSAAVTGRAPVPGGLSVVVPVYDEQGNVGPLIEEIVAALGKDGDYEIIFVDDGSRDATVAELNALCRQHRQLRVVEHSANYGQSAALHSGIAAATGDWIATLDGDGQNDPADIPTLLQRLSAAPAGSDLVMVAGVRRKRRDNWLRRASSRLANRIGARLLKDDTPDTGCGLKLFRRDAFLALPAFNHMHRFLPALIQRHGGTVEHVDVNHRPRHAGRSKYGLGINSRLWVGIADLIGVMWLQRRPLAPKRRQPND